MLRHGLRQPIVVGLIIECKLNPGARTRFGRLCLNPDYITEYDHYRARPSEPLPRWLAEYFSFQGRVDDTSPTSRNWTISWQVEHPKILRPSFERIIGWVQLGQGGRMIFPYCAHQVGLKDAVPPPPSKNKIRMANWLGLFPQSDQSLSIAATPETYDVDLSREGWRSAKPSRVVRPAAPQARLLKPA
jgi:hypothetical protein